MTVLYLTSGDDYNNEGILDIARELEAEGKLTIEFVRERFVGIWCTPAILEGDYPAAVYRMSVLTYLRSLKNQLAEKGAGRCIPR